MGKFSLKNILIQRGISPEERRSVLEDLFVFGKENQTPYLVRMSILMVLSTIIAGAVIGFSCRGHRCNARCTNDEPGHGSRGLGGDGLAAQVLCLLVAGISDGCNRPGFIFINCGLVS